MPRAALPQELFEERRAVLEVLPTALRALGLPLVMPNLKGNHGQPQPAKYDELVSASRRADNTTKGEALLSHEGALGQLPQPTARASLTVPVLL